MTSPAFGLGWHLWRRHRFFALAFLTYGVVLAVSVPAIVRLHLNGVALEASIPLIVALFITISLFANRDADIVGRDSGYPTYLLTLPVRTTELVFWPMALCIGIVVSGWLALDCLILHPLGLALPLWWPALALAGLVALILAVFWMPLGVPYLRLGLLLLVIVLDLALGVRGSIVLAPGALVALFLVVIVLAYRVAVSGVARARQGDNPEWRMGKERTGSVLPLQQPFVSPHQAQFWHEWKRNGILLPLVIGAVLLFLFALFWTGHDQVAFDPWHPLVPSEQEVTGLAAIQVDAGMKAGLFFCLGLTPMLAMAMGCGVWRPDNRKPDQSLNPFYATRPLTSAAMVFAKYRMAAYSTLTTWGIVLLFEILILSRSAQDGATVAPLGLLLLHYLTLKTGVMLVLALIAALLTTWKNQVNSLFLELSGRAWISSGYSVIQAGMQVAFLMVLVFSSTRNPELLPALLRALPYAVFGAVLLKLAVGGWALYRCGQRHLIPPRTLAKIGIGWLSVAVASWVLLCWLQGSNQRQAGEILCGVLLFLPLTRILLAPLAMDWNRHR